MLSAAVGLIEVAASELEASGHYDHAIALHRLAGELKLSPNYTAPSKFWTVTLQAVRAAIQADREMPEECPKVFAPIHELTRPQQ